MAKFNSFFQCFAAPKFLLIYHASANIMWLKSKSRALLGQLGELESALMEWMWHRGEATPSEAQAECAPGLAYTTVMTTMVRLWKKGLLNRRKAGKAYAYIPVLAKEEYQKQLTHHLLGMALNEGKDAEAVLSHFVDVVGADEKALDRLEQLIKAKQRALHPK